MVLLAQPVLWPDPISDSLTQQCFVQRALLSMVLSRCGFVLVFVNNLKCGMRHHLVESLLMLDVVFYSANLSALEADPAPGF